MPKRRDKAEPPGSSAAGTIMLLIAAGCAAFPTLRSWPLVASAAGVGLSLHLVGSGRVYRPAVTRAADAITCRFNPWREAAFYFVLIGVPLAGLMTITGGRVLAGQYAEGTLPQSLLEDLANGNPTRIGRIGGAVGVLVEDIYDDPEFGR